MNKINYRRLIVLIFLLFGIDGINGNAKAGIPDYMQELVFENKKFTSSIIVCFPKEGDKNKLYNIRNKNYHGASLIWTHYDRIDKKILNYLVQNDFAYIETLVVKARTHHFMFYTGKFKNIGNQTHDQKGFCLEIGKRKVVSIDYTNKYKGSPGGIEVKFYALTFTYILEGKMPNLPRIKKKFKGKAKAFHDPDDGEWKLINLELKDKGNREYLSQISDLYGEYLPLKDQLPSLRSEILKEVLEDKVRQQAEALYKDAMVAVSRQDAKAAGQAYAALSQLYDQLTQEYKLCIVSRPNTLSGLWRTPANDPNARNYYIIVEAVTADGKQLKISITSEEDGKTRTVEMWGLRVKPEVFEQVKRDKMEDGTINRNVFGNKKRGYLTPQYVIPTTGGAITEW